LFIEALALCALYIEPPQSAFVLETDKEAFEKVIMLVEKMASAEGLKRGKGKILETRMKSEKLDKLDLLTFFRQKYDWYFTKKN
jgi:hypothetical protein